MKGYKVFEPDWTCRGFQYEVGNTYEHNGNISLCSDGFHFCKLANDCFNYYKFDPNNKVAEVEALGEVISGDDKLVTNKIMIVREIVWHELLELINTGKGNTGRGNTGHSNTGHRNTGNRNTGNSNTGYWNTGDWNTGDCNTGYRNTGYRNTGHRNTGDFNICDRSSGVFCAETPKLLIFDKPAKITFDEWRISEAYVILSNLILTEWIESSSMTDEEKKNHPEHETTGGYLKSYTYQEAWQKLWSKLDSKQKNIVKKIPNFNKDKFLKITGIDIND